MHRILSKLADWLIEKEEKEAERCDIPDEVIDEWLDILKTRREHLKKEGDTDSEEYEMLNDLIKKVTHIKEIRAKKCEIKK
ncbi:conserved hypothetical protein [Lebetimonas natsushimae]|uniref:Uncharacterized protein n=1 Tax=Lebetimonas natsushimae TaxID=1936991 RepID=A0A292YFA0_9BACT|nr:hypothetical protein [Lebetimonas natsushimae]GAX87869.1 conserved hypothetical protein [Lebetimonas natsushimae]